MVLRGRPGLLAGGGPCPLGDSDLRHGAEGASTAKALRSAAISLVLALTLIGVALMELLYSLADFADFEWPFGVQALLVRVVFLR